MKNYIGDDGSVGEEMLSSVTEIEERVNVIDLAVKEKYFTFEEALKLYKVSFEEYNKFKNG